MRDLMYPSLSPAIAQFKHISREQRERELSVRTRRSPQYDPNNIRLGELILAPSVTTFTRYSDNVYGQDDNTDGDVLFGIRPEVSIRSDLPLHQLNAKFFVEDGNYNKLKQEDYTDYGSEIGGRFDVYPGMAIPFALAYAQGHTRRDEPENRSSIDPTVFTVFGGGTGVRMSGDLIEVNGRTGFQTFKFDDTTSFAGGRIDNSFRDRTHFTNTVSVGFPQEAIVAPFVYGGYRTTTYDKESSGFSRDSRDIEGGVGSFFNLTRVSQSDFRIGYVDREFDDSSIDPVTALTYQLNFNWDATTLASFNLFGKREINETALDASSQIETSVGLGMLYELAPNILLKPELGYRTRDYQQSDLEIKAYTVDMQAIYKLNPNVWATLDYTGVSQEESGSTAIDTTDGYDENRLTLSLKFQL
ncbi:MAG: hypothetical protein DI586_05580 [Micavibrio aeruginosavorus]|uniref:Outer membrane beta-barrel domain protein n=1 Tax=Micavibrio aeruginosavorus TaxID=349221 RepID=A0A2W5FN91_9BACT|nr:MAG: hypothetical protein DI586_05580 [Micavibrio aeruginosavorus]